MNFKIEKFNKDDMKEQFITKYLELFNDEENLKFLSYTNIKFTRELVTLWVENYEDSNIEYYIALNELSEIIAILVSKIDIVNGFEILGTVVDKNYRSKGIGQSLIDIAIKIALEKGFKSIDVAVFADNKNMLLLMIKNNFKIIKIEYHKGFDGEDVIYLKRFM